MVGGIAVSMAPRNVRVAGNRVVMPGDIIMRHNVIAARHGCMLVNAAMGIVNHVASLFNHSRHRPMVVHNPSVAPRHVHIAPIVDDDSSRSGDMHSLWSIFDDHAARFIDHHFVWSGQFNGRARCRCSNPRRGSQFDAWTLRCNRCRG
jgi:hypothetical protein